MWRAFFLAIGVSMLILGGECLALHKVVLKPKAAPIEQTGDPLLFMHSQNFPQPPREYKPAEWTPWSLLGGGALVVLYSLTLRRNG